MCRRIIYGPPINRMALPQARMKRLIQTLHRAKRVG
jgi:hypothetical protein